MTITMYDVSDALIRYKIPFTFTIGEAKKFSDFFKDRRVGNILKKMHNTNMERFGVKVKKVGRVDQSNIWEWYMV